MFSDYFLGPRKLMFMELIFTSAGKISPISVLPKGRTNG